MIMGYRSSGMIFPFKGKSDEIIDLVNSWTEKNFKILESNLKANENIELEFVQNNLVILHNHSFFLSAYENKELWHEKLKKCSLNEWVIFFECIDSADAASYLIFKNNTEVRRVTESGNQNFYQEGEPQDFEEEWLNASIGYEHCYQDGDEWKEEIITYPDFPIDEVEDWEDYFKFYFIGSIENSTNHLARKLLSDLSKEYLGFDFINDFYEVQNKISLGDGVFSENIEIPAQHKKSLLQKLLFWK